MSDITREEILLQELDKLNKENVRLKNENFNLRVVMQNLKTELKLQGISINGFTE